MRSSHRIYPLLCTDPVRRLQVNAQVYDLSKFAALHPGGESVLYDASVAGRDSSQGVCRTAGRIAAMLIARVSSLLFHASLRSLEEVQASGHRKARRCKA